MPYVVLGALILEWHSNRTLWGDKMKETKMKAADNQSD